MTQGPVLAPDLPKGYSEKKLLAFIEKWQGAHGHERQDKDHFFLDLCNALGVKGPTPNDPDYCFEKGVRAPQVSRGQTEGPAKITKQFIDFYRKGCFVLEAKQGGVAGQSKGTAVRGSNDYIRAMDAAWAQALRYVTYLDHPVWFMGVVDIGHSFTLWDRFSGGWGGQGAGRTYLLADLLKPEVFEYFRLMFLDPEALDPRRRRERVTCEVAETFAKLARSLEESDRRNSDRVAHFLMRILFTLFAEDLGLLPDRPFRDMLHTVWLKDPKRFPPELKALWETMNTGGPYRGYRRIMHFNGSLFGGKEAFALTLDQLKLLEEAARYDWSQVEPSIFGTLFERALDPRERHKLGAHYTPRAYIERLVTKVVEEPLRDRWRLLQAEIQHRLQSTAEEAAGLEPEAALGRELAARNEIVDRLSTFQRELAGVKVLDPACGSGNFLYVTLERLKLMELEVVNRLETFQHGKAKQMAMDLGTITVHPHQFYGLERNAWARDLAELVLWIGYLQWQRRLKLLGAIGEPVLENLKGNIRKQDAVLAWDDTEPDVDPATGKVRTRWDGVTMVKHPVTGRDVPDSAAVIESERFLKPRPTEWPAADFIVGNPPFIGAGPLRASLGDGYVEALRTAYKGKVPDSADYVMVWWYRAAELVRKGKAQRFGFITTNSLPQTFNRRVVEAAVAAKPALKLLWAIPDHPWVDSGDGAAVRIAMTCGGPVTEPMRPILETVVAEVERGADSLEVTTERREVDQIHPDLSVGAAVHAAKTLRANEGIASPGVKLHGAGFIVTPEDALNWGYDPNDTSPTALARVIKPYVNGRDLTAKSRGVLVIDFFGLSKEEAQAFGPAYQRVVDRVKPERDVNLRAGRREKWWLFGETNPNLRKVLFALPRFVVTVETAKHRVFQFLDSQILPDNMLIAIGSASATHLGILSSRPHVSWALAKGGTLEDRPRYNKTVCFDTFPFPDATPDQGARIGVIAERLDAWRKERLAAVPKLTLTELYNLLEIRRSGQPFESDAQRKLHELACTDVLLDLHRELDEAVLDAYGWPHNLSDDALLERLAALNLARAKEEAQGVVRWLRPEFQVKQGVPPETAPSQEQLLVVPQAERIGAGTEPAEPVAQQPWPKDLPAQLSSMLAVMRSGPGPWTAESVRARFKHARVDTVRQRLEALEAAGALIGTLEADQQGWALRTE